MWKCEKCETINNEDVCVICGEKKPIKSQAAQSQENAYYNTVRKQQNAFKAKKNIRNKLIIILCIIVIIYSVATTICAVLLFPKHSGDNKPIAMEASIPNKIEREVLLEWVSKKTYGKDMIEEGIELEEISDIGRGPYQVCYRIKDTDIELNMGVDYESYAYEYNGNVPFEKRELFCIKAPAGLIIPDKVGEMGEPFEDDRIVYMPDGYFNYVFILGEPFEKKVIKEDTPVVFASKTFLEAGEW